MRGRRLLTILLSGTLVFGMAMPVNASSIDAAKEKGSELEEQKSAAEAEKADLANQLNTIIGEMEKAKEDIEKKQQEIVQKEDELIKAQIDENNQYISMKKRIKFMYENGNAQFIEILVEADSISDFLNKAEYINQISEYDRDMLIEFQDVVKDVEEQQKALEEERQKLEVLQNELIEKQNTLATLISTKSEEISSLESEIGENAKKIKELEAAAAEAERLRQEASADMSGGGSAGPSYPSGGGESGSAGPSYPSSGSGVLGNPCPSAYISSEFGGRTSPTAGASSNHRGRDYAAGTGAPIYASASGTVTTAGFNSARGYYVVINHGNGLATLYQHCNALYVSAGQSVSQGQNIAGVGSTGISTGPHLHFEVHVNGTPVDPRLYL